MRLEVTAPDGAPEIARGCDLAEVLVSLGADLRDGDVVAVTSKVVSKAEGAVRTGGRDDALDVELAAPGARVVARRGPTTIVRTRLGLTMAAAGIDASNTALGTVLLLPVDPDASARRIRRRLHELAGAVVGVIVTDTAGRAWREGQTDIAVGAAGLTVAEAFAGRLDAHGNELAVTLPAVADELAGAAELAQGKLAGRPFAVLRGRSDLVLPLDDDGPGASALVRPEGGDLFGYGAREAVVRALVASAADRPVFGAPAEPEELIEAIHRVTGSVASREGSCVVARLAPDQVPLLAPASFAHGWILADAPSPLGDESVVEVRMRPAPL
ncbi:coenzyme F420-0:L-glutamate ligase [Nocardioides acrostichi]|uniref:Coenzyme F420-0:L-glutamate ligase n=1 Tax=Nocardioides acrostichi TaxID=2784339 RepID=A0A930V167_9ACTN|nr:coenzyme F420-0:L-glutamate ligase [Nocardioides acrostichi]MBF4161852.1 coenzyme F420-0:L-glutamate ligase [Nocardioides acrostichi]